VYGLTAVPLGLLCVGRSAGSGCVSSESALRPLSVNVTYGHRLSAVTQKVFCARIIADPLLTCDNERAADLRYRKL